ncbi:MAG: OadG family protein [Clostridia bacterium]|nr:OadG family protein [Clostridia bacterium]
MIRTALESLLSAPAVDTAVEAAKEVSKAEADMGFGEGAITALLGYAVVFFGIILLMVVIAIFGKVMHKKKAEVKAEKAPEAPVVAPAPAAAPVMQTVAADVGMKDGHRACDLYNVDDKTAVMLMAIVADEAGIPLNELRFISIKEL